MPINVLMVFKLEMSAVEIPHISAIGAKLDTAILSNKIVDNIVFLPSMVMAYPDNTSK